MSMSFQRRTHCNKLSLIYIYARPFYTIFIKTNLNTNIHIHINPAYMYTYRYIVYTLRSNIMCGERLTRMSLLL